MTCGSTFMDPQHNTIKTEASVLNTLICSYTHHQHAQIGLVLKVRMIQWLAYNTSTKIACKTVDDIVAINSLCKQNHSQKGNHYQNRNEALTA